MQSAELLFLYAKSAYQYGICQTALDPNNVGALPIASKEDSPPPSSLFSLPLGIKFKKAQIAQPQSWGTP